MKNNTYRILAENQMISNNTWETGLNNNDLIIGPSGAGKTRGYVKPNILQCNESMVITDTKGNLHKELSQTLVKEGYKIIKIDFTNLANSDGYNPLDYIRYDAEKDQYNEQDIMTISHAMINVKCEKDPFWHTSAKMYLACLISYVLENLPKHQHTIEYVVKLYKIIRDKEFGMIMNEMIEEKPDSLAAMRYHTMVNISDAKNTVGCILAFLSASLDVMSFDGAMHMFGQENRINFKQLGKEKIAVFVEISDTDRAMDVMLNLFYTQALNQLCESADTDYEDSCLPVPVRFILDDFASNAFIPDFDKIISVIRSRNIYTSIILQSLSQLENMYTKESATTIINNCDNMLYLGGQDVGTAQYVSLKSNLPIYQILEMPLDKAMLFTRGQKYKSVKKYDLTTHPRYVK